MNRRQFLTASAAAAVHAGLPRWSPCEQGQRAGYRRANTDWLSECRYGISVHWTAQSAPRRGRPAPFEKSVDDFSVKRFVDAVVRSGSDYVIFTATHGLQMLPAPHAVLDRILPGRTCKRDLIGELADALAERGKPLMLYYNHSCNVKQDHPWEKAVGYHDRDKGRFAQNLIDIVGWMGERYGRKVGAWWFDSCYSLDARGPVKSVSTDMNGFQFPWERLTEAAKQGHADRLVTYNAGVDETFLYTEHQDYWAGETNDLKRPAKNRFLDNGLQWFGWTTLDATEWVHVRQDAELPASHYTDDTLATFVSACNAHHAPMTFNLGIYQDGTIAPASVEQMHRLGEKLPARATVRPSATRPATRPGR